MDTTINRDKFRYTSKNMWYAFYSHRWHHIDNLVQYITDTYMYSLSAFELVNFGILCEDKQFYKHLDQNGNLLGFDNGIYDLKNVCFRDGHPDDYVSLSVGYDYQVFDCDNSIYQSLNTFYQDNDVHQYFIHTLVSCLSSNKHQRAHVWKINPIYLTNLMSIYGDYAIELPPRLSINNRKSDINPVDQMLLLNPTVRIGYFTDCVGEITGIIKSVMSNDLIYTHTYFKDETIKRCQLNVVWGYSEHLPLVNASDEGLWRRLRLINQIITIPSEVTKEILMFFLLKLYPNLDLTSSLPPQLATDLIHYRKNSCPCDVFFNNNKLLLSSIDKLYAEYKVWHKEYYTTPIQSRKVFIISAKQAGYICD